MCFNMNTFALGVHKLELFVLGTYTKNTHTVECEYSSACVCSQVHSAVMNCTIESFLLANEQDIVSSCFCRYKFMVVLSSTSCTVAAKIKFP